MVIDASTIRNRLLKLMPADTLERLLPHLRPAVMLSGMTIDHIDGPITQMYFINRGLVSLVKVMRDGRTVEVGAVGIEGVTDPTALFGIDEAIVETMVQIPGDAFRIDRRILVEEMATDPALSRVMQQYTRFAIGQFAQTAACNRLHTLEERCCRWILTGQYCAGSDTFNLTHEFLGMMLGGPRSSVSLTAKVLQRAGCIDYVRGRLTVLDRDALESLACECYFETRNAIAVLYGADDSSQLIASI
ncbi:Crp/Fnr family transcriptional regulator [Sphingomonas sp. H39-1-10]|uniref:Crp/Fnr family transcriptional regulator n=1 Tax=Sphingomonas TaxID=13687 RepID=UPI0008898BF4|nr:MULTISPECIES: Crp/Fnr family transcriptional regulator [Sphingomonas]MDF0488374.1 Crp/Fnr family transcriptional regulator [Sphingomonas pollutisoli]SDA10463.1 cAMP-binding domain of CRP or a regulatory subunit of cAMP-dependent protein kinases [Sphingomonas sp. NFR15]